MEAAVGVAGIIGILLYLAFIIGFLILWVYVIILAIKFLRRGIRALDRYLGEEPDEKNNTYNKPTQE